MKYNDAVAVRMNGQIPLLNIEEGQEALLLGQIESLVEGKSLLVAASVTYEDVYGAIFESVFVSAQDNQGRITYYAALVHPSWVNLREVWQIPADTWSVYWNTDEGIVFSSDDVKICSLRCEDEEILYDLIVQCEDIAHGQMVSELTQMTSSDIAEPVNVVEPEPVNLTVEEWLAKQYSVMSVDQILQNIDEWSTEVLREVYQYESSGRSRPKVLSKVIEYLGYVGEDPRNPEPESFQQVDTQLVHKAVYGIDLDWDAVVIDRVEYILYKIDRTSDGGRTWDYIMTTDLLRYTDDSATPGIEYLYRITPYNGTSPAASPVYRSPSMPFLGKIPEDIKQRNAKVLSRDKGILQVHCPYCGIFTEKEISSNRKMNRAIENTNRANKLTQKAQQRQRKAEKFIAFGERMSFSADGQMIANQIETNHMIQDHLRGSPANALRHLVNDAEVQCRNCARTVNEI